MRESSALIAAGSALIAAGEDESYFIRRMHASVALAGAAAGSLAKLVHFELAGRYSVAALAARRMK